MKIEFGIWEIRKGRNDRYYIRCSNKENLMDDLVSSQNGLGMHGLGTLQELGVAILMFEKEILYPRSIQGLLEKELSGDNDDNT